MSLVSQLVASIAARLGVFKAGVVYNSVLYPWFLGALEGKGVRRGSSLLPSTWTESLASAPGIASCLTSILTLWMERECPGKLSLSWPSHLSHVEPHHTKITAEKHLEHLFPERQCGPSLHISVQTNKYVSAYIAIWHDRSRGSKGTVSEHLYFLALGGGHYYYANYCWGN